MKVTNLMVGDWVYNGECHSNMGGDYDVFFVPKQLTLEDFKFFADNDWDDADFDEFLKPIELTSEILEKNGFKQIGKKFIWGEIDDDFIEITPSINNSYRIKVSVADLMIGCNIWCSYVHELQHALKLLQIEKEIIL